MNVIWIQKRRWELKTKNFVAWSVPFCLIIWWSLWTSLQRRFTLPRSHLLVPVTFVLAVIQPKGYLFHLLDMHPHMRPQTWFLEMILPFSIYNILTREELIFSMETQVNKLVITYVSARLKTLAITIISCLGKVRKLELFFGMKGGALGLRLLKLVRWWWVGVEGAWEAVVMFHHDWEWECVMELLGLRMSRRDFAFSSVIGRSQVGHVRVMLGVEAWATSVVSITDCCG